jgi:hypothetical protein
MAKLKGDASITYFPVGNGDTTLITLADGTGILVDCNITQESQDPEVTERFDVWAYLLQHLPQRDGAVHLDAFILTHPDTDHCRGFGDVFYTGDPKKYSDEDAKAGRIIIDELWFAPRLFLKYDGALSDEAKVVKKEADRRVKLYKEKAKDRNEPGNRLRVVGYSDSPFIEGLEGRLLVPGKSTATINESAKDNFSMFILGPLKGVTDDETVGRNEASIMFQARFKARQTERAGLALFGGDAPSALWETLVALNEKTPENLEWDLLLAPHHCSWYFFSEQAYDKDVEPTEASSKVLDLHREGAVVIASSKPVVNNDDDPPSFQAAKLYKKAVGSSKFMVTSEHAKAKQPLPIVFSITENGPVKEPEPQDSGEARSAAVKTVVSTPHTYGR